MDKKKYVTLETLATYDKLIKQYINKVFGDIDTNNIKQEQEEDKENQYD